MTLHCLFQRRLDRPVQIGENGIQGIELMEISVPTDRRTRSPISRKMPVVEPLQRPLRRRSRVYSFRQPRSVGRYVVEQPVNPNGFGEGRVRRIRIVDNQREAFCPAWNTGPLQWRRSPLAVTCIAPRNPSLMWECCRCNCEGHRSPPLFFSRVSLFNGPFQFFDPFGLDPLRFRQRPVLLPSRFPARPRLALVRPPESRACPGPYGNRRPDLPSGKNSSDPGRPRRKRSSPLRRARTRSSGGRNSRGVTPPRVTGFSSPRSSLSAGMPFPPKTRLLWDWRAVRRAARCREISSGFWRNPIEFRLQS